MFSTIDQANIPPESFGGFGLQHPIFNKEALLNCCGRRALWLVFVQNALTKITKDASRKRVRAAIHA
jgi:hypothetical protein